MSEDNIKVTVKVRPLIRREKENKLLPQWLIKGNSIQHIEQITDPYTFDHVFDENTTTKELFDCITKPIVQAAINGINGTIFAYGQTSSGKTHTMLGTEQEPGVIVLAIRDIFQTIEQSVDRQFLLRVGYIEIYNEKILDLLDKRKNVEIKDKGRGEVIVCHSEAMVRSEELILEEISKGNKERTTGDTNMNERSSRSHAIFRIIIESSSIAADDDEGTDDEDGRVVQTSYLNLVDLAGSERANQTGATGNRLKEANNINKSLLSLSRVIHKLSENNSQSAYINYRDSKLTRILQASLGGNAMTAIICCITPAATEETSSTLNFGTSAKSIKNKPTVNEVISDAVCMKRLKKEIRRLECELEQEKQLRNSDGDIKSKLTNQIFERQQQFLQSKRSNNQGHRRRTWCPSVPHSPMIGKVQLMGPPPPLPLKSSNVKPFQLITTRTPQENQNFNFSQQNNHNDDDDDNEFVSASESYFSPKSVSSDFSTLKTGIVSAGDLTPKTLGKIIATPKGWRSVRPPSRLASDINNGEVIDRLQEEIDELSDFTKLEKLIGSPYITDSYSLLKSQLNDARNQIAANRVEQHELMAYRSGLMRKSLDPNSTGDDQKISDLQNQVLEFEKQSTINKTQRQQLIDENTNLLTNLRKQQQQTKLTEMEKINIEVEYEQYKIQTKRREKELIDALNENQSADDLKLQIDELKQQLKGLEVEKWNNDKLVEQLKEKSRLDFDQINDLMGKVNKIEELTTNSSFERNECLEKYQKLNTEYEKLQLEYDELSQQMIDTVQEQESQTIEMTKLLEEINLLKNITTKATATTQTANEEENDHGDEIMKLLQTTELLQKENENLSNECSQLQSTKQSLIKKSIDTEKQIKLYDQNLEKLNVEINNLKESSNKLKDENSIVLAKLIDSDNKAEQLNQENFTLNRQVIQLKQELTNFTDQLDEIEKIYDLMVELKEKNKILQEEIQQKSVKVTIADEDIIATNTTNTSNIDNSNLNEKLYNLTQENCLLKQKLNGWCEENEQQSQQITTLQDKINKLQQNDFDKEKTMSEMLDLKLRYEDVSIKLARYEPLKAINEILENQSQQFQNNLNVAQKKIHNYDTLIKDFVNLFDEMKFSSSDINGEEEICISNRIGNAIAPDLIDIFNEKLNLLIKIHNHQKELIVNLNKKLITLELHYDSQLFELRTDLNRADDQLQEIGKKYEQQIDCVDMATTKSIAPTTDNELLNLEQKYHELVTEKDENQKLLENLIEKELDLEDRLKNKDNLINQLQNEIDQLEKHQNQQPSPTNQKEEFILWIKTKCQEILIKKTSLLNFKLDLLESISELIEIILVIQENVDQLERVLLSNDQNDGDDDHCNDNQNVQQLQFKCTNLEMKIKLNKQQINKDHGKLKSLKIELEEKCEQINKLNVTNELNEKKLSNLQRQHDCVNNELFTIKERENHLEKQIKKNQQEINELNEKNQKYTKLEQNYDNLNVQLVNLSKDYEDLKLVHSLVITEKNDLYTVVENNRQVIQQTEDECNVMRQSYLVCMKDIKKLQEENDLLREKQQSTTKEIARSATEELNVQYSRIKEINQQQEIQINQLKLDIVTLKNDLSKQLIDTSNNLLKKQHNLETELSECQQQLELAKDQIKQLKIHNDETIKTNKEMTNQITTLQLTNSNLTEQICKLEKNIQNEKETATSIKCAFDAKSNELQEMINKFNKINEQFQQKNQQIKKLEQEIIHEKEIASNVLQQEKQQFNLKLSNLNEKYCLSQKNFENKIVELENKCTESLARHAQLEKTTTSIQKKLTEDNLRLSKENVDLSTELNDIRNRMRSEESFNEKLQRIHELETGVVLDKQKLMGENNDLRAKNQHLRLEVDELRHRLQRDRKDRRRSTHDETRNALFENGDSNIGTCITTAGGSLCNNIIYNKRTIETQTSDPIEPCGCQMMSQKIQQLDRDMRIRDCQLATMKLTLDNNPLRVENANLIKQISQLKITIQKQDDKINDLLLKEEQQQLLAKQKLQIAGVNNNKLQCATCLSRTNLKYKTQSQQTDVEDNTTERKYYNGSALITEDDNFRLKDELSNLRKKYELAKMLCHNRSAEIEKLKLQIKAGTAASAPIATLSDNGSCSIFASIDRPLNSQNQLKENNENAMMISNNKNEKENTPDNIPNIWSEQIKKQAIAHENDLQIAYKLSSDEITRLREIIDEMEIEMKEIRNKYEMAKQVCTARNRQIKQLESKIQLNGDGIR